MHPSRVSSVDLIAEHDACNGLRLNIHCVRKYGSLRIMAIHAHYFIGKMLYACVLYISVHGHASHHTCISYAKHDDDRLMILPVVSNIIRTKTIEQRTIPVVPHKAVAEVSKVENL